VRIPIEPSAVIETSDLWAYSSPMTREDRKKCDPHNGGGSAHILVGLSSDDNALDQLALAGLLAETLGATVTCVYVQPPRVASTRHGGVDAEWVAYLQDEADLVISGATSWVNGTRPSVDFHTRVIDERSVSRGLRRISAELGCDAIVIGPGSHGGAGHIGLGSVAHNLLHTSLVPVFLAPQGFAALATASIDRLVIGFRDTTESHRIAERALIYAQQLNVDAELLTFVLRSTKISGARIGRDPEAMVMAAVVEREEEALSAFVQQNPAVFGTDRVSSVVIQGNDATDAMSKYHWHRGDLFVLASSATEILNRVFLGSNTHALLRACTMPAVVVPRGSD
jgi:nucleotide-binding universal stress UspA family protein